MKVAALLAALLCCTASYGHSVSCVELGTSMSCGGADGSTYTISKIGGHVFIDRSASPTYVRERRGGAYPTPEDVQRREVRIVPQGNGKSCVFVMSGRHAVPYGCE